MFVFVQFRIKRVISQLDAKAGPLNVRIRLDFFVMGFTQIREDAQPYSLLWLALDSTIFRTVFTESEWLLSDWIGCQRHIVNRMRYHRTSEVIPTFEVKQDGGTIINTFQRWG